MSIGCQHCGRAAFLNLCPQCSSSLAAMLEQFPWLVEQLEITVRRQDRLNTGSVGKGSDNPSPINFGAMETLRDLTKMLSRIVIEVSVPAEFVGPLRPFEARRPPFAMRPAQCARWLAGHTQAIAAHPDANEYYTEIAEQVEPDEIGRAGPLWKAINRTERLFAGLCPTVRGHNDRGEPQRCDVALYSDRGEQLTRCPRCEATVDVKENRRRSAAEHDLWPVDELLKMLNEDPDAPRVSRVRIFGWIKSERLQVRGFLNRYLGITAHRIRRGDARVFSLSQARQLQWFDRSKEKQRAG